MYVQNNGLFSSRYFDRVVADERSPEPRVLPKDIGELLKRTQSMWEGIRGRYLRDARMTGEAVRCNYTGLPKNVVPVPQNSEQGIQKDFVEPFLQDILGYSIETNRSLRMLDEVAAEVEKIGLRQGSHPQRPDEILFHDPVAHQLAVQAAGLGPRSGAVGRSADGVAFCRSASFILDVKRFDKGVGADEVPEPFVLPLQGALFGEPEPAIRPSKKGRVETTATDDIVQVETYLKGYDKKWGVLTNGRSWRLMRRGSSDRFDHVRFDLILFLEDLRKKDAPDEQDLRSFRLFWYLFGPPAVAGGFLDKLDKENEKSGQTVRTVLRDQAHAAVEHIANGFWSNGRNGYDQMAEQAELDHLREVSLTLLYRLLFVLKAEALNLLPMKDAKGADTPYARNLSTRAIHVKLLASEPVDRCHFSVAYADLNHLFTAIDTGHEAFKVPAYNGGLFDPERHPDLARLELLDDALLDVLSKLIYLSGEEQVPYADLDVRDLGDIYEGLLEQRLTLRRTEPPCLRLANQKGERKSSGSYFTPDALVDHLVRKALNPLLSACEDDPRRILALKILDPAMGSGHFLVKVVDVVAMWLTQHCDPLDPAAPADNGKAEFAYWKRKVVENCVYGVDVNPMAVELARVALWLHSAEFGKPLSFVDHHLKLGNSLVGARLDKLARPALVPRANARTKTTEWTPTAKGGDASAAVDSESQLGLELPVATTAISEILTRLHEIVSAPSDAAVDVKLKQREYERDVLDRLAAHRLLADLWCAQWFLVEPDADGMAAYGNMGLYDAVIRLCKDPSGSASDGVKALQTTEPLVQRTQAMRAMGYGLRLNAFFHWELEFPEVFFSAEGQRRVDAGFDAVIGNPPWDKVKPERKGFYGPFGDPERGPEWDVANAQGTRLDALIARLHQEQPELKSAWERYVKSTDDQKRFFRDSGYYRHQVAEVSGKKTGGDPDLFKYFIERASALVRPVGRVALVVPGGLWQADGCTGLRRALLEQNSVEEAYVFENYRKWAFDIHASTKFTTFVARRETVP